jgi:hypothetical protein
VLVGDVRFNGQAVMTATPWKSTPTTDRTSHWQRSVREVGFFGCVRDVVMMKVMQFNVQQESMEALLEQKEMFVLAEV